MTINPLATELAREHRHTLLRAADDYRRAKTDRLPRASSLLLQVRPIRTSDTRKLAQLFGRLSPESRLARFLYPKSELSPAELRYFTEVDHHDHEALIAITRLGRKPIAVARYIRDSADPTTADVAMAVADDWQNRGVGSLLAARLAGRARREGVSCFSALTAAGNVRARRVLAKLGHVSVVGRSGATVSYCVALGGEAAETSRRSSATLHPVSA